jgi:hypothetical protein
MTEERDGERGRPAKHSFAPYPSSLATFGASRCRKADAECGARRAAQRPGRSRSPSKISFKPTQLELSKHHSRQKQCKHLTMNRLQMKSIKAESRSVTVSRSDVLVKPLFATSRLCAAIRQNPSFSSRIVMGMIVRGIMPKGIFLIPMTNIPLTPSFPLSNSVFALVAACRAVPLR